MKRTFTNAHLLLVSVALLTALTSGCMTGREGCCGGGGGMGGRKLGSTAAEAIVVHIELDPASLEKMKANSKATQLEALLVDSFSVIPGVTQYDSAGNPPITYVTILLTGKPYYQGNTVTSAQIRFLPETWGGLSRPAYLADRNLIVADHPRETFAPFYQALKDGKTVMCVFEHSDTLAKSECYLYTTQSK